MSEPEEMDVKPKKKVRKRKSKNVIDDDNDFIGETKVQQKTKKLKVEPPKKDNPLLKWLNKSMDSPLSERSINKTEEKKDSHDILKITSSENSSKSISIEICSPESNSSKPSMDKLFSKIDFSNLKAKLNAKLNSKPKSNASTNLTTPVENSPDKLVQSSFSSEKDDLVYHQSTPAAVEQKLKATSAKSKCVGKNRSIKDMFQSKNSKHVDHINGDLIDGDIDSDEHTEYFNNGFDSDDGGMFISNKYECRKVVDSTDNESVDSFAITPVKDDDLVAPPYSPLSPLCRKSPKISRSTFGESPRASPFKKNELMAPPLSPLLSLSKKSPRILNRSPSGRNSNQSKKDSLLKSSKNCGIPKSNVDLDTSSDKTSATRDDESPRKAAKNLFGTSDGAIENTIEKTSTNETDSTQDAKKRGRKKSRNFKNAPANNEEAHLLDNHDVTVPNNSISDEDFMTPKKKSKTKKVKEDLSGKKSPEKKKKSKKKESPNLNSSLLNYFKHIEKKNEATENVGERSSKELKSTTEKQKCNGDNLNNIGNLKKRSKEKVKNKDENDSTLEQPTENDVVGTGNEIIDLGKDINMERKKKRKRDKTSQSIEKSTNECYVEKVVESERSKAKKKKKKEKRRKSNSVEIRFDFESDISMNEAHTLGPIDGANKETSNEGKNLPSCSNKSKDIPDTSNESKLISGISNESKESADTSNETVENNVTKESFNSKCNLEDSELNNENCTKNEPNLDGKHKYICATKIEDNASLAKENMAVEITSEAESQLENLQQNKILNQEAPCMELAENDDDLKRANNKVEHFDELDVNNEFVLKKKRGRGRPKKIKIDDIPEKTEEKEKQLKEEVKNQEQLLEDAKKSGTEIDLLNDDKENERRSLQKRKTHQKKELQEICDNVEESLCDTDDESDPKKTEEAASLFKYFKKVDTLDEKNEFNVMKVEALIHTPPTTPSKRKSHSRPTPANVPTPLEDNMGGRRKSSRISEKKLKEETRKKEDEILVVNDAKEKAVKKVDSDDVVILKEKKKSTLSPGPQSKVKLASIFIQKPKMTKSEQEARQKFLQSGVPEAIRRQTELLRKQEELLEELEFYTFPLINHVTQSVSSLRSSIPSSHELGRFQWTSHEVETKDFGATRVDSEWKSLLNMEKGESVPAEEWTEPTNLSKALSVLKKRVPSIEETSVFKRVVDKIEKENCQSISQINGTAKEQTTEDAKKIDLKPDVEVEKVDKKERKSRRKARMEKTKKGLKNEKVDTRDVSLEILDVGEVAEKEKEPLLLWSEKYKPERDRDILGNGSSVETLRCWLETRRKAAERPCHGNSSDSDSDFISEEDSSSQFKRKHNTAILIGPPGCGMTCTVYALANQLGYKVIELNASCNRNGKRILADLSEATQSHQVSHQSQAAGQITSFFGAKINALFPSKTTFPSVPELIDLDCSPEEKKDKKKGVKRKRKGNNSDEDSDDDFVTKKNGKNERKFSQSAKKKCGISMPDSMKSGKKSLGSEKDEQNGKSDGKFSPSVGKNTSEGEKVEDGGKSLSIILIEDADILYSEHDEGFLAALTSLVASSKRPLILVANGERVSHLAKLMKSPSSLVLTFQTPPYAEISCYLQLVSILEGIKLPQDKSLQLVHHNKGDVRKSLLALQFYVLSKRMYPSTSHILDSNISSQLTSLWWQWSCRYNLPFFIPNHAHTRLTQDDFAETNAPEEMDKNSSIVPEKISSFLEDAFFCGDDDDDDEKIKDSHDKIDIDAPVNIDSMKIVKAKGLIDDASERKVNGLEMIEESPEIQLNLGEVESDKSDKTKSDSQESGYSSGLSQGIGLVDSRVTENECVEKDSNVTVLEKKSCTELEDFIKKKTNSCDPNKEKDSFQSNEDTEESTAPNSCDRIPSTSCDPNRTYPPQPASDVNVEFMKQQLARKWASMQEYKKGKADMQSLVTMLHCVSQADLIERKLYSSNTFNPCVQLWELSPSASSSLDYDVTRSSDDITGQELCATLASYGRASLPSGKCVSEPIEETKRSTCAAHSLQLSLLSSLPAAESLSRGGFPLDVYCGVRTLARIDVTRLAASSKRYNRFFNHLKSVGLHLSQSETERLCRTLWLE